MSKSDLLQMDGIVTGIVGPGIYKIQIKNKLLIRGRLSGKLMFHKIKVFPGDRVLVGVSPYDPTHGLVLWRNK